MQIGSEITYCPSPVYWPTPILAFAGLAGRSLAGEDMGEGRKSDLPGALLGFTEKDRQPVYVSPFAQGTGTPHRPCSSPEGQVPEKI